MPRPATVAEWTRRTGVVLVLAGLAIDLAGARWGSYIRSPIPGVYLADLLWVVGCVLAFRISVLRALPRRVLVVAAVCVVYAAVRAAVALGDPEAHASLILRDLVAFGYLALVPLVAVAVASVRTRTLVRLLRVTSLVMLVGVVAYRVDLEFELSGFATVGSVLGGSELGGMFFPGRADFVAVSLSVGILAWGRFPEVGRPQRVLQGVLFVAAMLVSGQAGQLAVVVALVWAVWRERPAATPRRLVRSGAVLGGVVVAGTLVMLAASVLVTRADAVEVASLRESGSAATAPAASGSTGSDDAASGTTGAAPRPPGPVVSPVPPGGIREVGAVGRALRRVRARVVAPQPSATPTPAATADGPTPPAPRMRHTYTIDLPASLGTVGARISTWSIVLHARSQSGLLAGDGLGRPTTLLNACDAQLDEYLAYPGRNKCPVDSGAEPMPLRDAHNWIVTTLLYQGVVGVLVLAGVVLAYWWRPPPDPTYSLTAVPVLLIVVIAAFSVVASSPFVLLSLATFTGFALSRTMRPAAPGRVAVSSQLSDNL